jgi:hypothetical protein
MDCIISFGDKSCAVASIVLKPTPLFLLIIKLRGFNIIQKGGVENRL